VTGEVEYPVPPLADREAVSLFCERAQLEPSPEIAELCVRLDSLPLAVELAAARARALAPRQILARLSQRLDLLEGGRDAEPRQQTLRTTIRWSYDLLTDAERKLFRRLSVFAGGWSLEAAETVCDADVDGLQSLVEKSLVRFADGRYSMLETIRDFAAEQLDEAEMEDARRRHRAFVVELAETSGPALYTADEAAMSARLAPDYANVRTAVSYALEAGEPDDAGLILGALYPFLISHGHLAEVREWVEETLDLRDRLSPRALGEALVGGGEIARFAGDLERAIELKEEVASLEAELRRPNWKVATLADLSEIALDQGDYERARSYAEASAAAGAGPRTDLCFAELALRLGDLAGAEARGRAALAELDEGAFNHACGLEILGETARRAGDLELARDRFEAALRTFAAIRDPGCAADCLDGLSRLAAASGDGERAGTLRGAAFELRQTGQRTAVRTDVPFPEVPEGALARGRGLTFDEAVAYTLSLD
jgi:tetratricopeptide (TPR) repeat protein